MGKNVGFIQNTEKVHFQFIRPLFDKNDNI